MNANTELLNAPRRLAAPPAPPHDPLSLLLAAWVGPQPAVGWRVRALQQAEISAANGALVLSPAPNAERRADEASGSFGGLRLPVNVALGPHGELVLLDPVSGTLKLFDACRCAFVPLPCTTRATPALSAEEQRAALPGVQRRAPLNHLLDAQGLAACGDTLYIADAGHARIVRVHMNRHLRGWQARDAWTLPGAQQATLAQPWAPGSLAVDGHGRLYATDALNQRIDRFSPHGRWERAWFPPGRPWHIAVDGCGRLLALLSDADALLAAGVSGGSTLWQWQGLKPQAPAPLLWRMDGHAADPAQQPPGESLPLRSDLLDGFAPPPLAVDAQGRLCLPCAPCSSDSGITGAEPVPCSGLFDARGQCVKPEQQALAALYRRQGSYLSQALDSAIEACTWHRVQLRGVLPEGCSLTLRSYSADILLDDAELALLDDGAWSAPVTATRMDPLHGAASATRASTAEGRWDALLRSDNGRYLWLRLDLAGDGHDTPQIGAALVEYPRISLRRYLPAIFGAEPLSADFTDRFTALFDATLRSIEGRLDTQAALFDPLSAPAQGLQGHTDFLSWLASWVGLALERDWPEARKRRYLKAAAGLYARRGTPQGLRQQLLLLLGLDRAAQACLAERPATRCQALPLNCGPGPRLTPAAPPALLLEHFKLRRWLFTGRARLGDDSVLWGQRIVNRSQLGGEGNTIASAARTDGLHLGGSHCQGDANGTQLIATPDPLRDPLLVHANRISLFVPASVRQRPADERALRQLLNTEVPAHIQTQLHYVAPRFRVGVQAMVGLDTVIARTPQGLRLGDTATVITDPAVPGAPIGLGRDTVLPARHGAEMQLGRARVGDPSGLA